MDVQLVSSLLFLRDTEGTYCRSIIGLVTPDMLNTITWYVTISTT